MMIEEQRYLGRAKNALLEFLERRLSVPKIYFDADWSGQRVDVLAINRDGVGDVHAVLMLPVREAQLLTHTEVVRLCLDAAEGRQEQAANLIARFAGIQAHFKYIAAVFAVDTVGAGGFRLSSENKEKSFAEDGIGRIGVLNIEIPKEGDPLVSVETKPERFRASVAMLADEFLLHHSADWEIRA